MGTVREKRPIIVKRESPEPKRWFQNRLMTVKGFLTRFKQASLCLARRAGYIVLHVAEAGFL